MNIEKAIEQFYSPPLVPVEGFGRHTSWIMEILETPWRLCWYDGFWKGGITVGAILLVVYMISEHVRKQRAQA